MRESFNRQKRASVMLSMLLILSILSESVIYINKIYNKSFNLCLLQLRQDAHMLSVEALYAETLNQISWVNKQLKRMALLTALALVVPELLGIVDKINTLSRGLKYYQDFLLKSLPYKLLYYDKTLSLKNNLSFTLHSRLYDIPYKRGLDVDLMFIKIPGLIKFNSKIFENSCITHKNIFNRSKICLEYKGLAKQKKWFAPTEELWKPHVFL